MNSYIKHIIEAFDFNSVNKQKNSINTIDMILLNIVNKILNNSILTDDDKNFILSLPAASYKTNNEEICQLVKNCIIIFGDNCNLNWIDTYDVTDMSHLFYELTFNGDISKWNVSNVTAMKSMFSCSVFNGDISEWNVSNVTDMSIMFSESKFNGDISEWDVSNVTNMEEMFCCSYFNNDISKWDVSNVTSMKGMFCHSEFNGDISNWNINKVNNMCNMFSESKFNRDISNWNAGRAYTYNMFDDCYIKAEYKPKNIYGY